MSIKSIQPKQPYYIRHSSSSCDSVNTTVIFKPVLNPWFTEGVLGEGDRKMNIRLPDYRRTRVESGKGKS